jgi:hypothetical protein
MVALNNSWKILDPSEIKRMPASKYVQLPDVRAKYELDDSTGVNLGAEEWSFDYLHLIIVPEASLAFKLGLRSDDELESVDNQSLSSLIDFKRRLRLSLGKEIVIKVTRAHSEIELRPIVPEVLQ